MAGYGVDSGQMGSVAGQIDTIQEDVGNAAKEVGKSDIVAADFGRIHHQHGEPFTTLITKLGTLVSAESDVMSQYSKILRDTKSEYDDTEWTNSDIFGKVDDA